jgi:hypothetical protein
MMSTGAGGAASQKRPADISFGVTGFDPFLPLFPAFTANGGDAELVNRSFGALKQCCVHSRAS